MSAGHSAEQEEGAGTNLDVLLAIQGPAGRQVWAVTSFQQHLIHLVCLGYFVAWMTLIITMITGSLVWRAVDLDERWMPVWIALCVLGGLVGVLLIRVFFCHCFINRVRVWPETLEFSRKGVLHYAQIKRTEVLDNLESLGRFRLCTEIWLTDQDAPWLIQPVTINEEDAKDYWCFRSVFSEAYTRWHYAQKD